MPLITSIKLGIVKKLEEDKEFRKRFFRGQAEDEIASSIRSLREKRKKRQIDLAAELGMQQSAISRIEQVDYCAWTLNTLFRVADALDTRLRVIFEPTEIVIEHYRDLESGIDQLDQRAEFHEASVLKVEMPRQELQVALDNTALSAGVIYTDTNA